MKRTLLLLLLLVTAALAQDPQLAAANAYLRTFASAASWNDLLPHVSADTARAIAALPADDKTRIFVIYQKLQQAVVGTGDMEVKDRTVNGDRVQLVLQVVGAKPSDDYQGQVVNLVREDGQWKVDIAKVVRALGSSS